MGDQAIDISAGLIPKQQIDLSAGLVPKSNLGNLQTLDPNQPGMQAGSTHFDPNEDYSTTPAGLRPSANHFDPLFYAGKGLLEAGNALDNFKAMIDDADKHPENYQKFHNAQGFKEKFKALLDINNPLPKDEGQGLPNRVAQGAGNVAGQSIQGEALLHVPEAGADMVAGLKKTSGKLSPRGVLADRMAEVPAGERFSRQQILDAAREKGVNLDLADATDSGVARGAKNSASVSIAGKGTMEANATKNLSALEDWANSTADKLSPSAAPREAVGAQMQAALKSHLEARQGAATQLFNDLDSNTGGVKPDATSIYDKAQQIVAENKAYYDKNPALKQGRAWQIVNDLAQREAATKATTSTVTSALTDESGRPYTKEVQNKPQATPDSWQDLQKLRSDIMSEYRSPDVVGTRAEGWLKQLAGEVDRSMTGAGSGLSGPDLAKFRQANSIWDSIKSTYDNPQSPYYNAVRTPYPSNLPANLASRPEVAAQVRQTLSSLRDGSTAEGAFQRQFVENLINDKSGKLDLKNLNSKLSRTPDDVLRAMVGDEGAKNLRMLGKVSQKVTGDVNPSATGKVLAPFSEGALLFTHPAAGAAELGANYAGSKLLTNPRAIDFLTKKKP